MLSIKFFVAILFLSVFKCSLSQDYRTYVTDSIPLHTVTLKKDSLFVNIIKKNIITPSQTAVFHTKTINDTIYIVNRHLPKISQNGVIISNAFFDQFLRKKIYNYSKNQLIINNRPYYKKTFVSELIGPNKIYYVNGKLFKIGNNKSEIDLTKILKNPKKTKIKILDGKKAYEKYGVIGINGIIEIFDRKRCR